MACATSTIRPTQSMPFFVRPWCFQGTPIHWRARVIMSSLFGIGIKQCLILAGDIRLAPEIEDIVKFRRACRLLLIAAGIEPKRVSYDGIERQRQENRQLRSGRA